ncbi:hypothetical protein [Tissierella sp.]|uniref:hypothetical protein n=1 Tax=Tissierella sp. TaxID=41274 RepID=UPI003030961E
MECITRCQLNLMNEFHMLWEQHSAWTRMAITSIVFNLPDEKYTVNRLLRNPLDFGEALKPFYGDTIATNFAELLTKHLTLAADLVKAVIAGDNKKAEELEKNWYKNAEEIATLLGTINPFWSEEEWKRMLFEHLDFVKTEALDMINKDYEASIETYDKLEIQALEMADVMSNGIIKQFPCKFYC